MIFCIDLLLFYITNIRNFISSLGGLIYWTVCWYSYSISDHIEQAVKDLSMRVLW